MTDTTPLVTAAAPGSGITAEAGSRTISGRVLPYGPVGRTSSGELTFSAGSVRLPDDPKRVKLLVEHDQRSVVGFATALDERPDGLHATFYVPESDPGNLALSEALAGLRDAFSVGVEIDSTTTRKLRRAEGAAVPASGALREVSLVSVPAYDGALVDNVAASAVGLVVSAWKEPTNREETPAMTETLTPDTAPDTSASAVATASTAAPAEILPGMTAEAGPAVMTAAAGHAALVTGEPSTYTFASDGPSLVRDAFFASQHGDREAGDRLARFNAELATHNPASELALAAVVVSGPIPDSLLNSTTRTNLVNMALDRARPIASRLATVPINSASPFYIPTTGEFSAVGDHTEGTPHVAEGTLTLGESIVTPRAVSGAFRVSREVVESSNPALDRVAVAAMVRDYRRHSEAKIIGALATAVATPSATGISTAMALRGEIVDMAAADDEMPDFLVAGGAFYGALAAEVDADGRPMLPAVGPANALGTLSAGSTGTSIDGVEVVRAASVATGEAWLLRRDDVLFAESPARTFRFDEVEGPGIVKVALWAYVAAAVLNADGVRRLTSA